MSNIAIRVENLSKAYQLGDFSTGTLSRDIHRWWSLVRGKEDPFLKIGETNNREAKGDSDIVWSLKDINFDIQQGDAVGIIGRNGAGKSTLLKILSRVTSPTLGNIKVKGRIASLLEVGTGFHPELTGRENIYLNGAILGMRKAEITKHFDAIVDFAGVERYVDTPVKRYSSGMYVRLAFAVAAHLESEILVVDEVLAVGDAEFQKKCLGKMSEVSNSEGRTVLFVSHNMAAVSALCSKSILLKRGQLQVMSSTGMVIDRYMHSAGNSNGEVYADTIELKRESTAAGFHSLKLRSKTRGITTDFAINEDVMVEIEYDVYHDGHTLRPSIHLLDALETCILTTFNGNSASTNFDKYSDMPLKKGRYKSTCILPANFLNDKNYRINAFLVPDSNMDNMAVAEGVLSFTITETGEMRREYTGEWWGLVRPKLYWDTEMLPNIMV
ncbi:lipopolysaccharide transport system ATP-binding protein [Mucilaginibacter yixingensis]|uniref:Lipopolysaccharide transport system ATP-binding protein n=1 Tax=Mucilaginibacter yixingensis TaxID=1295612 RepID=A0A2T5JC60_9SPHI|nr:polysaccharide ABC transporter ATP-binding protein [Mucilaginibacter yixingensis]PTQ99362.1 lipopolysaccharide transport system ATP-binding protein [Mucilaginibacter yixingensis]